MFFNLNYFLFFIKRKKKKKKSRYILFGWWLHLTTWDLKFGHVHERGPTLGSSFLESVRNTSDEINHISRSETLEWVGLQWAQAQAPFIIPRLPLFTSPSHSVLTCRIQGPSNHPSLWNFQNKNLSNAENIILSLMVFSSLYCHYLMKGLVISFIFYFLFLFFYFLKFYICFPFPFL